MTPLPNCNFFGEKPRLPLPPFLLRQRRSQNLKQVLQNIFKVLSGKLRSQAKRLKINHCCQIRILGGERPRILVIICCFLFVRQDRVHINAFLKNRDLSIKTSQ